MACRRRPLARHAISPPRPPAGRRTGATDDPQRCPRRRVGGVGGRARRRRACSPTGAPTSSRSNPPPVIRSAACSAPSASASRPSVPPFEVDNRGKRSVVLDLRSEAGSAAMERLLERADVFVTNIRLAALERLGSIHRAVRRRHPRLIYGIITGYGLDGPDAHRPGYDIGAFWARSSLAPSVVPPGHAAAADPRRTRRPRHRDDPRRWDLRGAVRPRAHRAGPPRVDEPAPDGPVLRRRGTSGC